MNMRSLLKIVSFLLIGFIAGIVIYAQWGIPAYKSHFKSDSILVTDANAGVTAQELDETNENITTSRQTAITRAVIKISPAVVSVNVLQVREYVRRSPFNIRDPFLREFFPELFKDQKLQQEIQSLGSGFIISNDGYIITNDHVVGDATKIVVTMIGGAKLDAELIGRDPTLDVSLLKVDEENLKPLDLGNSDEVILGEWAIAVGNPFGLFEYNDSPTVTVGVISALDRDFGEMEGRIYQDMIQTDASINHGNSGGPLCNALGEVIAMNTFIYTGSRTSEGSVGIGFAIPINRIKNLLDDLKENKRIDRDFWIGIKVQNLNDVISRKMGFKGTDGVLIRHIDRGSPAEEAGMQLGDIILGIGDSEIHNEEEVKEIIYGPELKVGDDLTFKVWRDDRVFNIEMNLISIRGSRR